MFKKQTNIQYRSNTIHPQKYTEDKHSDKSCFNSLSHAMSFVRYLKFMENRNIL